MDVEETRLPGIGVRHEVVTDRGRRIGVVARRDGRRDLAIYQDGADADDCAAVVNLSPEEAGVVARLLGAARVDERLARLRDQVEGLRTEGARVLPGSPYDGRTLGDTRARTRTGASVVAVVRDNELVPSPAPDFVLRAGDRVIVVGTEGGVGAVARILASG